MKKLLFPVLCVLMASFIACGPNEPDEPDDNIVSNEEEAKISSSHNELVFFGEGVETITLTVNEAWHATTNVDWIKIFPSNGRGDAFVKITCAAGTPNEAEIIFSTGNVSVQLPIKRWYGKIATEIGSAVDLGLPSGLKWASSNVGAYSVSDFGDYYAWGEVTTKKTYSRDGYKYYRRAYDPKTNLWDYYLIKYCSDSRYYTGDYKTTLEQEDDAAHVNWKGDWRMPTEDECTELREKCRWAWGTLNGVNGCYVMGNNDNSIFLPAAGHQDHLRESGLVLVGEYGYYWSSSRTSQSETARVIKISSNIGVIISYNYRYAGSSVRPVCP